MAKVPTPITAVDMKIEEWHGLMGRIDNPDMGACLDAGRKAGVCIFGWETVKKSWMVKAAASATRHDSCRADHDSETLRIATKSDNV